MLCLLNGYEVNFLSTTTRSRNRMFTSTPEPPYCVSPRGDHCPDALWPEDDSYYDKGKKRWKIQDQDWNVPERGLEPRLRSDAVSVPGLFRAPDRSMKVTRSLSKLVNSSVGFCCFLIQLVLSNFLEFFWI